MPGDPSAGAVCKGRIRQRRRPSPFDQVLTQILVVDTAVWGHGSVIVFPAQTAAYETLNLEARRLNGARGAAGWSDSVLAYAPRLENEDSVKAQSPSSDLERGIVVDYGVAPE